MVIVNARTTTLAPEEIVKTLEEIKLTKIIFLWE